MSSTYSLYRMKASSLVLVVAAVLAIIQSARCAFFDLTDIDDPMALLWHTKDTIFQKNRECNVTNPDGAIKSGVCKHASECLLSGGRVNKQGPCGILSTCCSYERTCGRVTRTKVSYFSSPQNPLDDQFRSNCEYTVNVENDRVCQVRLDFELFQLSRATDPNAIGDFRCHNDALVITPNNYGIPVLCGNNNQQHVYVHLDQTMRQVHLKVRLARRNNNNNDDVVEIPLWKIKVTQLECPRYNDFLFTNHYSHVVPDFKMLAPRGAIQYFTENNGRIRSFGLDLTWQPPVGNDPRTRLGTYTSNMNYAIAFERTPDVRRIRFTNIYMNLPSAATLPTIPADDASCSTDYLFIPGLTPTATYPLLTSRICGLDTAGTTFFSNAPGPLYIYFTSSAPSSTAPNPSHTETSGFDIRYHLVA